MKLNMTQLTGSKRILHVTLHITERIIKLMHTLFYTNACSANVKQPNDFFN